MHAVRCERRRSPLRPPPYGKCTCTAQTANLNLVGGVGGVGGHHDGWFGGGGGVRGGVVVQHTRRRVRHAACRELHLRNNAPRTTQQHPVCTDSEGKVHGVVGSARSLCVALVHGVGSAPCGWPRAPPRAPLSWRRRRRRALRGRPTHEPPSTRRAPASWGAATSTRLYRIWCVADPKSASAVHREGRRTAWQCAGCVAVRLAQSARLDLIERTHHLGGLRRLVQVEHLCGLHASEMDSISCTTAVLVQDSCLVQVEHLRGLHA